MQAQNEVPLGLLGKFYDAMDGIAARRDEEAIQEHIEECPARRACEEDQPSATVRRTKGVELPFEGKRIPRPMLVQIVERMSTEDWTVYQAAEEYDLPPELLQRELADFQAEYRRELLRRSDPWDLRWRN